MTERQLALLHKTCMPAHNKGRVIFSNYEVYSALSDFAMVVS